MNIIEVPGIETILLFDSDKSIKKPIKKNIVIQDDIYIVLKLCNKDEPISRYFFLKTITGDYKLPVLDNKIHLISGFQNDRIGKRFVRIINDINNNMNIDDINVEFYDFLFCYLKQRNIHMRTIKEHLKKNIRK